MSHSHINKAKSSSKISHINVLIEFQSYKSMRGERKTPPKLRLLMNELLVNAYERIQLFFFRCCCSRFSHFLRATTHLIVHSCCCCCSTLYYYTKKFFFQLGAQGEKATHISFEYISMLNQLFKKAHTALGCSLLYNAYGILYL